MALIWNNEPVECQAHVIDWRSSGLRFVAGKNGCHARRKLPGLLVVHFTGAENPPPVMFANMQKAQSRSVEFGMDYYGQIWQFCDPAKLYCAQAQGVNTFSFGIEIQNRGVPSTNKVINRKFPRGQYAETMSWGVQSYMTFTAEQLTALEQLVDALVSVNAIPAKFPVPKRDFLKRIPKKVWPRLRGVVGHYQVDVEPGKIDPGPQVLDELWRHFNE